MNPTPLYQVLYVSTICAEQPLTVVAAIAHHARAANAQRGIGAMLVFDGVHFCQLLEGDQRSVLSLTERICSDTRHQNVEVLQHGPADKRRFEGFELAFTNGEDDMSLERLVALDGQAAVDAFDALCARLPR